MSMSAFIQRYGTEAKCYRALYKWRWPQGFRCPGCHGRARSRFKRGTTMYYQCRACRHQTTLTAGTLFEGTKLPLRTWMLAGSAQHEHRVLHVAAAMHTATVLLDGRELARHEGGYLPFEVDLTDALAGGAIDVKKPVAGKAWKAAKAHKRGFVNLVAELGQEEWCIAYGYTEVHSVHAREVVPGVQPVDRRPELAVDVAPRHPGEDAHRQTGGYGGPDRRDARGGAQSVHGVPAAARGHQR
jgi:hypothetical protein